MFRTAEETLRLPELGESLSISSVVLADQILRLDSYAAAGRKEPFIFGEYKVLPNPARAFKAGGRLQIYFLFYNLALDDQGKNSIELNYVFRREGRLYRKAPSSYQFPSNRRERSVIPSIPLKEFAPGEYSLTVSLTDRVAGKTLTAEIPFRVR